MKTKDPHPADVRVPSKWSWHYDRLQSLRDVLLADRADQVSEVTEPLEPHSMDDADSATDEFDHNLALGILSYEEDTLHEVDAAMQRILDGTYGICEVTKKPIPEARLRVVPWTRYTREALESLERAGKRFRPRLAMVSSVQGKAPGGLSKAPVPEDFSSYETARRNQRESMRDLVDAGLTITFNS